MDAVWIAVISAVGSVLAALAAWMQAVRTGRITTEAMLAAERLKTDAERRRRAFDVARDEARPLEAALDRCWNDIQTVKDGISSCLASSTYDHVRTLDEARAAVDSLAAGYRLWGAQIEAATRSAWHSARGAAGNAVSLLDHLRKERATGSSNENTARAMMELRVVLTDRQLVLAEYRNKVLHDLTTRMLNEI